MTPILVGLFVISMAMAGPRSRAQAHNPIQTVFQNNRMGWRRSSTCFTPQKHIDRRDRVVCNVCSTPHVSSVCLTRGESHLLRIVNHSHWRSTPHVLPLCCAWAANCDIATEWAHRRYNWERCCDYRNTPLVIILPLLSLKTAKGNGISQSLLCGF